MDEKRKKWSGAGSVLKALIVKELIQTLRDKKLRVVIFLIPVIQMLIFGVAVTNDVHNLPLTICDQDQTTSSREVASSLTRGGYFVLKDTVDSVAEAKEDLLFNRSKMVVIIPHDFHEKLMRNEASPLQILLDGSDGNSATIAMGYAIRILQDLKPAGGIRVVPLILSAGALPPSLPDLAVDERVWYNPGMESSFFMIPGVVTMILTIITTLLTAMGITREKEIGTFEQLIVSPITGWQLMLGKTLPYALIGFVDALLVTLISILVFSIPLNGPIWLLALLNIVYIFAMLGLGLFISTVSSSQQQAMMTVFAVLFPFVILSDFFFPLENMPAVIRYLTVFNPMKYCLTAQREIFLKGSGWESVYPNILSLFLFSVSFFSYGSLRFRKNISM